MSPDPRIRPPEGSHIGYISGCVCRVCEDSRLRKLEKAVRALVAEAGESEALSAIRSERDALREANRGLNAIIAERNEDHRRIWTENENRRTEIEILKMEIHRLGGQV